MKLIWIAIVDRNRHFLSQKGDIGEICIYQAMPNRIMNIVAPAGIVCVSPLNLFITSAFIAFSACSRTEDAEIRL